MRKNIAMRCTQKQFEAIKPKLEKSGKIVKRLSCFDKYPYLANNFSERGYICTTSKGNCFPYEFIEQWNEKIFLEACGISVIPTPEEVREYFKDAEKIESKLTGVITNNNNNFRYREDHECYYLDSDRTIEVWSPNLGYAKIISYKKPKYEISEEQILHIYGDGCTYLEEWFPEVLKKELEVGKWYKYNNAIVNYQGFKNDIIQAYGFNKFGDWINGNMGQTPQEWEEATTQEVTEALTKEAVRRGLVKGAYCNHEEPTVDQHKPIKDYFYHERDNCLYGNIENEGGANIFKKGQWATIIPTKTKEEAEKLLNCKII